MSQVLSRPNQRDTNFAVDLIFKIWEDFYLFFFNQQIVQSLHGKLLQAARISFGIGNQWHRLWEYVIIDGSAFITISKELFPHISPPRAGEVEPNFLKSLHLY